MMPALISLKLAGPVGLALAVALAAALWRADNLGGKLDKERAEHKATQEALVREVEKGAGWIDAYNEAFASAEAHRQATAACIERAAAAETARQEREAILQAAPPGPRTEAEKQQVVTDDTRKRAADRLNRPW